MKHLLISCLLLSAAGTLQAAPKSNIPPLKLWYNKPATAFEESLPIGNGKLGALIYGGANNDSIYLNDITLWTGKPVNREEGGDAYKWIPTLAVVISDGRRPDTLSVSLLAIAEIEIIRIIKAVEAIGRELPIYEILGMEHDQSRYTVHRGTRQIVILPHSDNIRVRKFIIKQRVGKGTIPVISRP